MANPLDEEVGSFHDCYKKGCETDPLLPHKNGRNSSTLNGFSGWLKTLENEFGFGLLALLFVTEHLNKGLVYTMQGNAEPYVYKFLNIPAPTVQVFEGITALPWAAKPMFGIISDAFPLRGLNKAPYLAISSVLGTLAFVSLSSIPFEVVPVVFTVVMIMLVNLQEAVCDTLSEARYAAEIRVKPTYGPDMLTYVWAGLTFASLVGTLLSGIMLEYWSPRIVYVFCAPIAALVLYSLWKGHMEETVQTEEVVARNRQRLRDNWEVCLLCAVIFGSSLLLMVCGCINQSPVFLSIVSIVVCVVVLVSFSTLLSPVIAKLSIFLFLDNVTSLDIGGAAFYFYTDSPAEYPAGPHFSPFFYTTVLGAIGAVFSLVGIYCYKRFTYDWTYRNLMIMTNVVGAAFGGLDIIMFARLNVKWGIPDHVMVVGNSIFGDIFFMWSWMPTVVVLSHFCPKGMEATVYALLAGCANLGGVIADNLGSWLLQILHCEPNGTVEDATQFNNLWVAALISTLLPLVEVVALIGFLPNARQNESVEMEDRQDITAGSLWKTWRGTAGLGGA